MVAIFFLYFWLSVLGKICILNFSHIWNQLPDTLEAKWYFQTFKRPPSDWFGPKHRGKVSSCMNTNKVLLRSRLNLGFNLNHFCFLQYTLCIQNYSFLHCMFLFLLYHRINKPNIHNNVIGISSFQNGLQNLFSSTGFCFKSKVIEGSHKGKNMLFLSFEHLFSKCTIFMFVTFFSCLVVIQSTQFLSGRTYL